MAALPEYHKILPNFLSRWRPVSELARHDTALLRTIFNYHQTNGITNIQINFMELSITRVATSCGATR
jgi:hypothetical protein